ncbi:hypothetical protein J4474_03585 [Candidatus Pacearchaeota archaeon]|nr:hypothetical protein [Candidatus Pacearchaeota archaeon]
MAKKTVDVFTSYEGLKAIPEPIRKRLEPWGWIRGYSEKSTCDLGEIEAIIKAEEHLEKTAMKKGVYCVLNLKITKYKASDVVYGKRIEDFISIRGDAYILKPERKR